MLESLLVETNKQQRTTPKSNYRTRVGATLVKAGRQESPNIDMSDNDIFVMLRFWLSPHLAQHSSISITLFPCLAVLAMFTNL